MVNGKQDSPLALRTGHDWMMWFGQASVHMPDLHHAFKFLEGSCALIESNKDIKSCSRQLKLLVNRFIGQARCPSAQSCERIAVRARIMNGWLQSELHRESEPTLLADVGAHGLQKLLAISEGADDKHAVLSKAVREFTRDWLGLVANHIENSVERALLVYPIAMLDQVGLIDPAWWWNQIALCDRHTVLGLIELEISNMNTMQPTSNISLRSFDKRWRRLRLRALLEYLSEKLLLAELLRKSAVDDFEAVIAIRALRDAGRSREAIVQAEQWLRTLPRSSVLADVLFQLYAEDGWDEEALMLAITHYGYDPNPIWIDRLGQLGLAKAKEQINIWQNNLVA